MNMDLHFQIEFVKVILAYLILYIGLPLIAWKKVLKDKGYLYRFLFCILTQTFFVINLALGLGLLHILNRGTFTLGVIIYTFVVRYWGEYKDVIASVQNFFIDIKFLILGEYGKKLFFNRYINIVHEQIKEIISNVLQHYKRHFIEYLFLMGICLYSLWLFSYMPLKTHTYSATDMPVHHFWIYEMAHGNLFVKGIYPFGMHCMIYGIYAIFGIPLKSILLFFGSVQSLMTILMLYALMKTICKGKFSPIIATIFYVMSPMLYNGNFGRMIAALPQETGMYALYPIVIFAGRFLNRDLEKKPGLHKSKIRNAFSFKQYFTKEYFNLDICLFSISIALTFMIHSYVTIIAFFLCVGIGIAYFTKLFKKQYFIPIFVGGVLGILIAFAPFAVGRLEGIKFQGSIGWAQNIIQNSIDANKNANQNVGNGNSNNQGSNSGTSENNPDISQPQETPKPTFAEKFERAYNQIDRYYVLEGYASYTLFAYVILFVFALLMLFFKKTRNQARHWMALGIYFSILFIFANPTIFGTIELVQAARVVSFFIYAVPIVLFIPFDFIFVLIDAMSKKTLILLGALCSYVYSGLYVFGNFQNGNYRKLDGQIFTQSKDASDCVDLIIDKEQDWQWTVLGTTAELYQVIEHGFHYEITDYLFKKNVKNENNPIYIPTPHFYVFVEKNTYYFDGTYSIVSGVPYNKFMENLKPISDEFASQFISETAQPSFNYSYKRVQLFSKINLMVQKLKEMYPQDVSVFYETDDFVCYKVEQNPYYLFNLNFDYLQGKGGVTNETN